MDSGRKPALDSKLVIDLHHPCICQSSQTSLQWRTWVGRRPHPQLNTVCAFVMCYRLPSAGPSDQIDDVSL